jgi:hypothetical protein
MKGGDLERAAAAPLQTTGWFVMRRPSDETFQALELDVLAYRFDSGAEESLVLESKGGKSGFGDLWKRGDRGTQAAQRGAARWFPGSLSLGRTLKRADNRSAARRARARRWSEPGSNRRPPGCGNGASLSAGAHMAWPTDLRER